MLKFFVFILLIDLDPQVFTKDIDFNDPCTIFFLTFRQKILKQKVSENLKQKTIGLLKNKIKELDLNWERLDHVGTREMKTQQEIIAEEIKNIEAEIKNIEEGYHYLSVEIFLQYVDNEISSVKKEILRFDSYFNENVDFLVDRKTKEIELEFFIEKLRTLQDYRKMPDIKNILLKINNAHKPIGVDKK